MSFGLEMPIGPGILWAVAHPFYDARALQGLQLPNDHWSGRAGQFDQFARADSASFANVPYEASRSGRQTVLKVAVHGGRHEG